MWITELFWGKPYYDVAKDYKKVMPGEGPFFTDYLIHVQEIYPNTGLHECDWNETLYPKLAEHKSRLIQRFNRTFAFREIGQETVTRFQFELQNRFDEIAEHYDHAYKVTSENNVDIIGLGYTLDENYNRQITTTNSTEESNTLSKDYTEAESLAKTQERNRTVTDTKSQATDYTVVDTLDRDMTSSMESEQSRNADTKYKDTPGSSTSTLNNPTNQTVEIVSENYRSSGADTQDDTRNTTKNETIINNDSQTDVDSTTQSDTKNTTKNGTDSNIGTKSESGNETIGDTRHVERIDHDEHAIDEINHLINAYKSIDNEFLKEFEVMFIGLVAVGE